MALFFFNFHLDGWFLPSLPSQFYSAACGHSILERNETVIMKITFETINLYNCSMGPLLISGVIFTSRVTAAELNRG